jgi:hypothetical protein
MDSKYLASQCQPAQIQEYIKNPFKFLEATFSECYEQSWNDFKEIYANQNDLEYIVEDLYFFVEKINSICLANRFDGER